ncbi:hypothetical protein VCHA53O466_320016 [Vibrio chagasii]|nr:hypothetical protein VCHA53O466_320016 [Vibrio chagasii]
MKINSFTQFLTFAENVASILTKESNGQIRRKKNFIASCMAKAIPNTPDNFNINTLKDCFDNDKPIPQIGSNLSKKAGWLSSDAAKDLPDTGIWLLWNVGDEPFTLSDFRVVTGDEYRSDAGWGKHYSFTKRLRKSEGDIGFDSESESIACKHGVEALILEVVMCYGGISPSANWRMHNDIKRLNVGGWKDSAISAERAHTQEYLPPLSDFCGHEPERKELSAPVSENGTLPFTYGSEGWDKEQ